MVNNNFWESIYVKLTEDEIEKVVVGAIILFNDSDILLLERSNEEFKGGLVELPSGAVKKEESVKNALTREVAEETGLNIVEIKEYLGSFDYLSSSGKKTRQLNFRVVVAPGDVRINTEEHCRFYIVNLTDKETLHSLNISRQTRKIIEKIKEV
jgi:8-oxo-dGTP diphosphatase